MNTTHSTKLPREILPTIYRFAPNRETLGGSSYFIVKKEGGVLVDCPPWHEGTETFLQEQGGVKVLYITHRAAISNQVLKIQTALNCEIVIQEQEAYLMPEANVSAFRETWEDEDLRAIWTSGFSPASSCLYYAKEGGCLFTGRHLLPNQKGELIALRTAKTFHWGRQLKNIETLINQFNSENLNYILPAANIGFLRGTGCLQNAYAQLLNAVENSQNQPNIDF